jgi:hypothetical protein
MKAFYRYRFFLLILLIAGAGRAAAQERTAFLVRGNGWSTGFPGIGANAFPVFFGDYRLEGAALPADGVSFSVYICREFLVLDERLWRPRPELTGFGAVQRVEADTLLVAFGVPPDQRWTVLFRFAEGEISDAGGLDSTVVNRLIRTWTNKFLYYYSLAKTDSDLSFPAVLNF